MEFSLGAASNMNEKSIFEEDIEESSIDKQRENRKDPNDQSYQNINNDINNNPNDKNSNVSMKELSSKNNNRSINKSKNKGKLNKDIIKKNGINNKKGINFRKNDIPKCKQKDINNKFNENLAEKGIWILALIHL